MQEYEHQIHEDNAPGWKANHYPRRKMHKGWLVAIVFSALLFFCIGISLPRWTLPVPAMRKVYSSPPHSVVSKPVEVVQPPPPQILMWPPKHTFYFFMNPTFTAITTNEVSTAIHLTPEQVTIKIVNTNYGLSAVAADQGIRIDQLFLIEQHAINDMLAAEIKAGYIQADEANAWKNQFWYNPGKLDNVVGSMFSGFPVDISY